MNGLADLVQKTHTRGMHFWGRVTAFSLAFIASMACPAMGTVQAVAAADHIMPSMEMVGDESITSPVPECCLRPLHDAHDAGPVSTLIPRVDGSDTTVQIRVVWAWATEENDSPCVAQEGSPPSADFECRSMMKRE